MDAAVSHRSRPLQCHAGLHRPTWVLPLAPVPVGFVSFRVCAGCGTILEGGYWDTAATTVLAGTAALVAGAAVGIVVGRAHRDRR